MEVTGYCKPFKLQMSRAECELQEDEKTPHVCEHCAGLEKPVKQDQETETMAKKKQTCSKCNTPDVQIIGKGLCYSCRQEELKDGSYELRPGKSGVVKTAPAETGAPAATVPADTAASPVPESAPRKGLLSGLFPAPPEDSRPGLFLDFTGHEDLLTYVLDSEHPNSDLIGLIDMLRGDLLQLKPVKGEG